MKFQVKFYDIIDHNKCSSSEKSAEKCILRKSFFHHSEPTYDIFFIKLVLLIIMRLHNERGPFVLLFAAYLISIIIKVLGMECAKLISALKAYC